LDWVGQIFSWGIGLMEPIGRIVLNNAPLLLPTLKKVRRGVYIVCYLLSLILHKKYNLSSICAICVIIQCNIGSREALDFCLSLGENHRKVAS